MTSKSLYQKSVDYGKKCESEYKKPYSIELNRDGMNSKSVELRFVSVRVGLGVTLT